MTLPPSRVEAAATPKDPLEALRIAQRDEKRPFSKNAATVAAATASARCCAAVGRWTRIASQTSRVNGEAKWVPERNAHRDSAPTRANASGGGKRSAIADAASVVYFRKTSSRAAEAERSDGGVRR